LPSNLIHAGDEIGVFDGDHCVAAVKLLQRNIEDQKISIPVPSSDGMEEAGFTEGNNFALKIWKAGDDKVYQVTPLIFEGFSTFKKNETSMVSLEKLTMAGIKDKLVSDSHRIRIFPNPTNGNVFLKSDILKSSRMTVQVYNATGQLIIDQKIKSDTEKIDLSGKAKGVFYFKIFGNSLCYIEKVILK
jgi:hypothetical protein